MAGAVAGAVKAERLVLLTDVEGVLDKDKKLIAHLTVSQARALLRDGTVWQHDSQDLDRHRSG